MNLEVTKHGLTTPLVTRLQTHHLLAENRFHSAFKGERNKTGQGRGAGTNPAPWKSYGERVAENCEKVDESARYA